VNEKEESKREGVNEREGKREGENEIKIERKR
jgi:hypothetical protein